MVYLNNKGIQYRMKLYCYYPLDHIEWAKDAVCHGSVFCNRMEKYNDIFDGKFYPNKDNLHDCSNEDNQVIKNILEGIYDKKDPQYNGIIKQIKDEQNRYLRFLNAKQVIVDLNKKYGNQYNFAQIYLDVCKKRNSDGANVLCHSFSEVKTSLLMWSYYASSHTGLCIEYNLTNSKVIRNKAVDNLSKVNYCDNFPNSFQNEDFYFYKSREWAHEQEWRLVVVNDKAIEEEPYGRYIDFPFASAIYLGVNFPNEKKHEMKVFCAERGLDLYQMQIVPNKYEIEAKDIVTRS